MEMQAKLDEDRQLYQEQVIQFLSICCTRCNFCKSTRRRHGIRSRRINSWKELASAIAAAAVNRKIALTTHTNNLSICNKKNLSFCVYVFVCQKWFDECSSGLKKVRVCRCLWLCLYVSLNLAPTQYIFLSFDTHIVFLSLSFSTYIRVFTYTYLFIIYL